MNKQSLIKAFNSLAKNDQIFQVEAELRDYLVNELKQQPGSKIQVGYEYPVKFHGNVEPMFIDKTSYIDLVIIEDDKWYPIEIKFFKAELKVPELYNLKSDSSPHAFDYVKDIRRLELFKEWCRENNKEFGEGFAIVLSNNGSFFKPDLIQSTTQCYDDFQLRPGKTLTNKNRIWFKYEARECSKDSMRDKTKLNKLSKTDQNKYVKLESSIPYTIKWNTYQLQIPMKTKFMYMIQVIK